MPIEVQPHHIHDFTLTSPTVHDNPFTVSLFVTFTHESGETLRDIPGFYDGGGTWKIRFSPTREGLWGGFNSALENPFDDPAQPCVLAVRVQSADD